MDLKTIDELAHAAVTAPESLAHEDIVRLGAAWLDGEAHADRVMHLQRRLGGVVQYGRGPLVSGPLVRRLGEPPQPNLVAGTAEAAAVQQEPEPPAEQQA